MNNWAIRVENLGKRYIIHHQVRHPTLRHTLTDAARSLWYRKRHSQEEFWALKDLVFEVQAGERLGIIGRNGAGKSTLLKLLSRIMEPSTGRIHLRGRVASLLEVGTGFHPELTGRENIFLNGSILGMQRVEIKQKFDEIVDFAGVERFLDTPVKRYSSGMYVRLAFAIAAHLDPEILVIDEVLAVGDIQFQKKCLGKMQSVSQQEGRTVLFVSHNMSVVESLCTRGILMDNGHIKLEGSTSQIVQAYLEQSYRISEQIPLTERRDRIGSGRATFAQIHILNRQNQAVKILQSGEDYRFAIAYQNNTQYAIANTVFIVDIFDERGQRLLLFRSNFSQKTFDLHQPTGTIYCEIPRLPLAEGLYRVMLFMSASDSEILDCLEDAHAFSVEGGDFFGTGSYGLPNLCKILHSAQWSQLHSSTIQSPGN